MAQVFQLKNGDVFTVIESPGGMYHASQLRCISELAERHALWIKVTEDQRLGLMLKKELCSVIEGELAGVGLTLRHYRQGLHQPVSCLGDACPLAKQDAMQLSVELAAALSTETSEAPLRIAINGCSQSCVPSYLYDVALQGASSGFSLAIAGRSQEFNDLASLVATKIPSDQVVECVLKVVNIYKQHAASAQDTLHDVVERTGLKPFIDALHPYSKHCEDQDIDLSDFGDMQDDTDGHDESQEDLNDKEKIKDSSDAIGIDDDLITDFTDENLSSMEDKEIPADPMDWEDPAVDTAHHSEDPIMLEDEEEMALEEKVDSNEKNHGFVDLENDQSIELEESSEGVEEEIAESVDEYLHEIADEEVVVSSSPNEDFGTISEHELSAELSEEHEMFEEPSVATAAPKKSFAASHVLTGVDIDGQHLKIHFANGVSLALSLQEIPEGAHPLDINRQRLEIMKHQHLIEVRSGGTCISAKI